MQKLMAMSALYLRQIDSSTEEQPVFLETKKCINIYRSLKSMAALPSGTDNQEEHTVILSWQKNITIRCGLLEQIKGSSKKLM